MPSYRVKCIDAKYDRMSEMIVLQLLFIDLNEPRIAHMSRSDFSSKANPDGIASHQEMENLAVGFKRYPWEFTWEINDDPNRVQLTADQELEHARSFRERIYEEMDAAAKGLSDESGQIQRKLYNLKVDGKLDPLRLLRQEQQVRKTIGDENNSQK